MQIPRFATVKRLSRWSKGLESSLLNIITLFAGIPDRLLRHFATPGRCQPLQESSGAPHYYYYSIFEALSDAKSREVCNGYRLPAVPLLTRANKSTSTSAVVNALRLLQVYIDNYNYPREKSRCNFVGPYQPRWSSRLLNSSQIFLWTEKRSSCCANDESRLECYNKINSSFKLSFY